MTIAAQLRVAIALLIALLVAILLAAFYVPSQLQRSANEKYVEDAIPLRYVVQDLATPDRAPAGCSRRLSADG